MAAPAKKGTTQTRFVAFYSYKGGVGRTLALANCARDLAAGGKKIVLLDFDLEAPGLLHFEAFQPKKAEKKPAGFVEYFKTCLENGPPETLDGYIHECRGKPGDVGKAWLMPAGRHDQPGYLDFLNGKTWSELYTQQEGYKILENLRGHIIDSFAPDYVLIDARTGLSEIGGIATHQLADIVVLLFNLNGQNLDGAKRVFASIRKAPLQPAVILVASPVPVVSVDKGTPFAKKMREIEKGFPGAYNQDHPLVIPYHPLLAFEDRLLVDDGDLFSSDAPYRNLVQMIQKVASDADIYLKQMLGPMQRWDWQQVKDIAQQGLLENSGNIHLLMNLSLAYYFTENLEDAVETTNHLLRLHADTVELPKQILVAQALYNKGVILGQLQKSEEAIAAYDELLQRFGDYQQLALLVHIARALVNKGLILDKMQRPELAILVYDELLRQFKDSHQFALQEQVAKALLNKGVALGQIKRTEDELAIYDDLLQRFGDSKQMTLKEYVAKALGNKGLALGQMQRLEEEIAVYDEMLRQFAHSQEPVLQAIVSNTLNSKGYAILLSAKRCRNDVPQQRVLIQIALDNFKRAITSAEVGEHSVILGNQAYALFLLGRQTESESLLRQALALGGQSLYEAELADSHLHPLPEDKIFREMLDRLWVEAGGQTTENSSMDSND